ncbi:MAG: cyclic nucleotide-binding domain-containing protein [Ardenticatenaceae bacterium]|nr:cyclic nucleotide-binding domain-containing protein [Ardenticatenaceae bacterium]
MTNNKSRVHQLPNSAYIVETRAGSVLVNCPPETLKNVLAFGFDPPQIILLPPDIPPVTELGSSGFVRHGINYASVEFMLYANFFAQSRTAHIITPTDHQANRLHLILQETFEGPVNLDDYGEYTWLNQECRAVSFYPSLGRAPNHYDLCSIESLESGLGGNLGKGVTLEISDDGRDFIFLEDGYPVAAVPTAVQGIARPMTLAPARPVLRRQLTLQFIGGSDGFDPTGITTCFLAYLSNDVQTQATLFDTAAYLRLRLSNLGLSASQISEVVISHLHEDHLAGLPELLLMGDHRIRVITSDLIYKSLLRVLGALFDMPPVEVAALFDYLPLNPGQPLTIGDRTYEAIYAVHSIPTIAVRVNGLYYSGDMRYDEAFFDELVVEGILSKERRDDLIHFAEGAEILVQDAGGGAIHTTITPQLLKSLAEKGQRIILAHTNQDKLPVDMDRLGHQIEIASSGFITSWGEMREEAQDVEVIETIEACPLFVRLPFEDRVKLSEKAIIRSLEDGEMIIDHGSPVNGSIYLVHSGIIEIRNSKTGEVLQVAGRGSSVGERWALMSEDTTKGTYSVVAKGDVQLLEIERPLFLKYAGRLKLKEAFDRADWLWQQSLFKDLLWGTLLDMALDFEPRLLESGETLFSFGEPGYECYLLVEGQISVHDANHTQIDVMDEPAIFFGSRTTLYNQLRNATAKADTDSLVWALPAPSLQRLLMVYPHLALHMRALEMNRTGEAH